MESLFARAGILSTDSYSAEPRKLQTAVFLAQTSTGHNVYRFRTSHGKVMSDELDRDIAQLQSAGMFVQSCSFPGKRSLLTLSAKGALAARQEADIEGSLRKVFSELIVERCDVLEAAATRVYFATRGRRAPDQSLRWLMRLDQRSLTAADALIQTRFPAASKGQRP